MTNKQDKSDSAWDNPKKFDSTEWFALEVGLRKLKMTNKNSKIYSADKKIEALIKERDELNTGISELKELKELRKTDPLLKSKRASILLSNIRAREAVERTKIDKMVKKYGVYRARMAIERICEI